MIDHAGDAPCTKPVVDIHDGDTVGAGVEHAQQRRNAAEAGAVADTRRHGDHRHVHHAGDDAWQRPLHPRDDDDDAGVLEAAALAQDPMNAGDADVVQPLDVVAHQVGGDRGLLGDADV